MSGPQPHSLGPSSAHALKSYAKIADKLLEEGFLLTALELHVELIEKKGQSLKKLSDYFQDPKNFEKYTTAPSQQTNFTSIGKSILPLAIDD